MSKKTAPTRCIVVDASIAYCAGADDTEDDRAVCCRQFLQEFWKANHRVAFNAVMQAEWVKHMSPFARLWLTRMVSKRKMQLVPEAQSEGFREAVEEFAPDAGVKRVILKDAHLVEMALVSDRRVASLDDTVRGHLLRLVPRFAHLASLLWVNPENQHERALLWLQHGAPEGQRHRLGNFRPGAT